MITFEIWFAVLPATMGIAEVVMVLVEHTNLPLYLGAPLAPLLEVLGIPNANLAASAMMVSFGDQFLPVIMGANIESELSRFVILVLAVNQLIFMSEVGAILLRSAIPINFGQLFIIFILRTLVALPIVAGFGHHLVSTGVING